MAKNLKLKIKNTQLAKAAGLDKVKEKLIKEKKLTPKKEPKKKEAVSKEPESTEPPEEPRRIRAKSKSSFAPKPEEVASDTPAPVKEEPVAEKPEKPIEKQPPAAPAEEKLGPTGKHVKDLLRTPAPKKEKPKPASTGKPATSKETKPATTSDAKAKLLKKGKKVKDFKDLKPAKRGGQSRGFDARDRAGLSAGEDERWRKKRGMKHSRAEYEEVIRPSELSIRLPITIKDLASEMKLKSSQLIQKLFLQNMIYTLNDYLEDETTVDYLGSEFGCQITIDTSEEERIQITAQSIQEEIKQSPTEELKNRPPVVAFMGHVDHGKTSLIDAIRKTNVISSEAGAITQHIGAFTCSTAVGDLTILDTPGHEAFSAMRARGAEVTDIVVLVVAGDEGMREQTVEAIQHAKAGGVTIVVAINKSDKPGFNEENVYRELSENELLPEKWGGQTITVNTSAVTGDGIKTLLEMLALQSEVLELKANPSYRGRGTVLESEMHKGLGSVATVLVQNGTLNLGDALVFERHYGRIKTMHDENSKNLQHAGPSAPVEITGLSGLPSAGDPFIVVKSEKEAKNIVETREVGRAERALMQRKVPTLENLLQEGVGEKKVLNLIIRADVQGSAEALKTSILKIESEKAESNVIFMGIGEISESDIQLAAASNAVVIGFHTAVESHADSLIKEHDVKVRLYDVIYHAIDDVKMMMQGLLDKLEEEKDVGEAQVQTTFKSSHLGVIAGCLVSDGVISRNHRIRVLRDGEIIWRGGISSIKRIKEDVKEVKKGLECGIVLEGFAGCQEGDILQAYEIIYLSQEL